MRGIVLAGLLFAGPTARSGMAQSSLYPPTAPEYVPLEPITSAQGLSHDVVRCLLKDRRGFMWFGTANGLTRFDGRRHTVYRHDPGNAHSLSFNAVQALFEDPAGHLWIGTGGGGLNRFDPATETFVSYRHDPADPESISHDDVRVVRSDGRGGLWVGTAGGGLDHFDPLADRFAHIASGDAIGKHVSDIQVDRSGNVWTAFYGHGVARYEPETGQWIAYPRDFRNPLVIPNPWVRELLLERSRQDTVWVMTGGGAFRLLATGGRFVRAPVEAGHEMNFQIVSTALQGSDGVLWFGGNGLARYEPADDVLLRVPLSTLDEQPEVVPITDLLEDDEGVLWVATFGGGVHRLYRRHHRFVTWRHRPGLVSGPGAHESWGVLESADGSVWLSSRSGGGLGGSLDRFDPVTGVWDHRRPGTSDLPHRFPGFILGAASGMLWIASDGGGLMRFDPVRRDFTRFRIVPESSSGLPSDGVKVTLERRSEPGVIWIGTEGGGLARLDPDAGTVTRFRADPQNPRALGSDWILALHESPREDDQFWIGTLTSGLHRFEPETGRFTRFRHVPEDETSISGDAVTAIVSSRHDPAVLWIGVYGGGLNRYDRATGGFRAFRERDGLADDGVVAVEQDARGRLWIGTDHGLSRFDPADETFVNFYDTDGLQGNRFHNTAHFYSSRTGLLYFGGPGGLSVFHPDSVDGSLAGPPVVLTGLELDGRPVGIGSADSPLDRHIAYSEEVRLSHRDRVVTFRYAALEYVFPDRIRYAYRMTGHDSEWIEVHDRSTATYSNLGPGLYSFEVRASGEHGVWSQTPARVAVRVLPPWWATAWFRVLVLLAALSVAYVGNRNRRRMERQRRERLEIEVLLRTAEVQTQSAQLAERNRELQDSHREIEAQSRRLQELDALKSRFFNNISHEFRTPLTLILGPVEDALHDEYGRTGDRLKRQLRSVRSNAKRLHRLIDQMLDLSRLESGALHLEPEAFDLVYLLRGIVHAFASHAERRRITLAFRSDLECCSLCADPDKLEKVFVNLLSNAFKFTPPGGTVTVHCGLANGPEGDHAVVSVTDTGLGIPEEKLPLVFDRFFQVDGVPGRVRPGSGIGLALARELVELHGGTIVAESTPGSGSRFTVTLPRCNAPEEVPRLLPTDWAFEHDPDARHEPHALDGPRPADAPTVLVVDDDEDIRAYIRDHLTARFHVVEASNGAEGLDAARQSVPALILSDVMMPVMDGRAFCAAVRQDAELHHIPVVLLTALASDHERLAGLECGADDYLCKPFNANELLARVENLIAIRCVLREHFRREVVAVEASRVDLVSADRLFLDQVQRVVEEHLGESRFSVEWLADEVAISPRQLQRRLKTLTGMSAGAYIRCLRLQRAAQELGARCGTVSEIADRVGFRDTEYFSRVFRQVFGMPPSEYAAQG